MRSAKGRVTQMLLYFSSDFLAHQAPLTMGILQARILEWVAIPFSRGSSQPRDRTWVFFTAGRFFTNWATILVLGTIVLCLVSRVQLCDPMDYSQSGSSDHGDSPGKNTGVGCHALLQGIFPTQGSNLGLLNCRQILYCLSHQGSPLGTINENQI